MSQETRQAHQAQSGHADKPAEESYKSTNLLASSQMRNPPERKFRHGAPVTLEIGDEEDPDVVKGHVQNPTLNRSNQWQYQVVGENSMYLENGKWYAESELYSDPARQPRS
ncbi:hypothetical protein LTR37_015962 [Vermiconidia calcicola]|uniref:Uncharacterized protein n=1 Tax=Vermiconidia calcicola TaxID=1690605 RepID=A0ACC3MPJ6_9PEZI|nr:hypothetical protein LTR37_015962 [Vermiconidia calcicola]